MVAAAKIWTANTADPAQIFIMNAGSGVIRAAAAIPNKRETNIDAAAQIVAMRARLLRRSSGIFGSVSEAFPPFLRSVYFTMYAVAAAAAAAIIA